MRILDLAFLPVAWLLRPLGLHVRLALLGGLLLALAPIAIAAAWGGVQPWLALGAGLWCVLLYLFAGCARELLLQAGALARIARNNARGDLSQTVVVPGRGELAQAGQYLESMNENFSGLVGTVRNQAVHVAQAGTSLTESMQDLSQRTGAMETAVAAMGEIATGSRRMGEIVNVIDGIAFQTNILALNAAVEAARAGESGRGFAVVASEVRTLAQRSATSAREIRALIERAGNQVDTGVARTDAVKNHLRTVVQGVREVADGLNAIAGASDEQSMTLREVSQAVKELDQITQRNGSMVEEALHSTLGLRDRSSSLSASVAAIRLRRGTADEAHALVCRAVQRVEQRGLAAAAQEFHDPAGVFRDRDQYIFVFDRNGVYQVFGSTPERVGKTVHDVPGLDGALVLREFFAAAQRGGDWVDYEVVNPITGAVDEKTSFILPLGTDRVIGCGVFKPKGGFSLQVA